MQFTKAYSIYTSKVLQKYSSLLRYFFPYILLCYHNKYLCMLLRFHVDQHKVEYNCEVHVH